MLALLFTSFAVMLVVLMAGAVFSGMLGHWVLRRDFGALLKRCYDRDLDREGRQLARFQLVEETSRHARIKKLHRFEAIWAIVCLLLWVGTVAGLLIAGLVFHNPGAERLLDYFK